MGKEYHELSTHLQEFVLNQPFFFVSSAPLNPKGHINVSPKGMKGTFQIISKCLAQKLRPYPSSKFISEQQSIQESKCLFCYLDLGGSGVETPAHLRENGRITVMFCSFAESPKILRFFGYGWSIEPQKYGWSEILEEFPKSTLNKYPESKLRNIVVIDVHEIRDSCGYGVPQIKTFAERNQFPDRYNQWSEEKMWKRRFGYGDGTSLDKLPSLDILCPDKKGQKSFIFRFKHFMKPILASLFFMCVTVISAYLYLAYYEKSLPEFGSLS
mmetsp:Transcript_20502/g.26534  ORF Transcript_20502/g.26534 Transcript_20502/m.26534 type:complete len:270 (+) Transcript_20502:73-882(+)